MSSRKNGQSRLPDSNAATHADVPAAGTPAPDFSLLSSAGELVHLADLRGKRIVLYFYPGDTPGCITEACGFRDSWAELEAEGVAVFGISRDSVKSHQKFANKYGLPFMLLSDDEGTVAQQYGVWVEKGMYGTRQMSIARTTFYVRSNGLIGHVWQKVKPEGHAQNVLAYLEKV
jgi:thioredoxin-dependent peroxiredoxin